MTEQLSEMNGTELVRFFNSLVNSDTGRELNAREVTKFKDRETGIRRIEALQSSIRAREQGLSSNDTQDEKPKRKSKKPKEELEGIAAFELRAGSSRGKALQYMWDRIDNQVQTRYLAHAAFGDYDKDVKGVIKHIEHMIKKLNLNYEIRKEESSYGLYNAN